MHLRYLAVKKTHYAGYVGLYGKLYPITTVVGCPAHSDTKRIGWSVVKVVIVTTYSAN